MIRRDSPEFTAALRAREALKAELVTYPSLGLQVYATARGVHLVARVDRLDAKGRLHTTQVARATWKPGQVTERAVVEWGYRALGAWLSGNPVVQD